MQSPATASLKAQAQTSAWPLEWLPRAACPSTQRAQRARRQARGCRTNSDLHPCPACRGRATTDGAAGPAPRSLGARIPARRTDTAGLEPPGSPQRRAQPGRSPGEGRGSAARSNESAARSGGGRGAAPARPGCRTELPRARDPSAVGPSPALLRRERGPGPNARCRASGAARSPQLSATPSPQRDAQQREARAQRTPHALGHGRHGAFLPAGRLRPPPRPHQSASGRAGSDAGGSQSAARPRRPGRTRGCSGARRSAQRDARASPHRDARRAGSPFCLVGGRGGSLCCGCRSRDPYRPCPSCAWKSLKIFSSF